MDIQDAASLKAFVQRFRVEPGRKVELKKDYDPADRAGVDKPEDMTRCLNRAVEFMAEHQDKLYAEKQARPADHPAGDGRGGQGRRDQARDERAQPAGRPGLQLQGALAGGAGPRLHVAQLQGAAGARAHRHLQPLVLRRDADRARAPEILAAESLPPELVDDGIWHRRFREMNNFEQYLVNNGIDVVKIFLNISKEEQRQRLLARIDTPEKNWKVSSGDAKERQYWDKYQECFNDIFTHTSTDCAPWYVVPADHKWFSRIVTAAIVAQQAGGDEPAVSDRDRDDARRRSPRPSESWRASRMRPSRGAAR